MQYVPYVEEGRYKRVDSGVILDQNDKDRYKRGRLQLYIRQVIDRYNSLNRILLNLSSSVVHGDYSLICKSGYNHYYQILSRDDEYIRPDLRRFYSETSSKRGRNPVYVYYLYNVVL